MRRVGVNVFAVAAAMAIPLSLLAQTGGRPQFRSDVDLVTLDVCVRDAAGRFVPALGPEDFVVLENGVPQDVTFFAASAALPINAVLLIDRSSSMHDGKLDRARAAAAAFARRLQPQDRLRLIAFNDRARIIPTAGAGPSAALGELSAVGATALYDAMRLAADELTRLRAGGERHHARDLIVVLSDGEDTASLIGFEEVLKVLRRSGALVYGLSLRTGRDGRAVGAPWPLLQAARDTGARAMTVRQLDTLEALYADIDAEVRQMYRLGYVSNDTRADGEWRRLAVHVRGSDGQARTRAGYYAPRTRATPLGR